MSMSPIWKISKRPASRPSTSCTAPQPREEKKKNLTLKSITHLFDHPKINYANLKKLVLELNPPSLPKTAHPTPTQDDDERDNAAVIQVQKDGMVVTQLQTEEDATSTTTDPLSANETATETPPVSSTDITLNPFSWPKLPPSANPSQWHTDAAAIHTRLLAASSLPGAKPYKRGTACLLAHAELISGQYGMPAPVPCQHCVHANESCRIYHPKCYKWGVVNVLNTWKQQLGWTCMGCRAGRARKWLFLTCDVRWEAEVGEPYYAANRNWDEYER